MKKPIICLLIALPLIVSAQLVQSNTTSNNLVLFCQIEGNKVYSLRDTHFKKLMPQSKFIGNAVYESTFYINNNPLVVRFDCRTEKENISFDKTNYIFVKPQSCSGELHRLVCGY
jgi:hypothetical protein